MERFLIPTLERLATYLRFLIDLEQSHVDTISSAEVERQTGINAAQFRKDLSYFGIWRVRQARRGLQRSGSCRRASRASSRSTANSASFWSARATWVPLWSAIPACRNTISILSPCSTTISARSDAAVGSGNPGRAAVERRESASWGRGSPFSPFPHRAAQKVADQLVDAGIHAILNFAPVLLRVPDMSSCAMSRFCRNWPSSPIIFPATCWPTCPRMLLDAADVALASDYTLSADEFRNAPNAAKNGQSAAKATSETAPMQSD